MKASWLRLSSLTRIRFTILIGININLFTAL